MQNYISNDSYTSMSVGIMTTNIFPNKCRFIFFTVYSTYQALVSFLVLYSGILAKKKKEEEEYIEFYNLSLTRKELISFIK